MKITEEQIRRIGETIFFEAVFPQAEKIKDLRFAKLGPRTGWEWVLPTLVVLFFLVVFFVR